MQKTLPGARKIYKGFSRQVRQGREVL